MPLSTTEVFDGFSWSPGPSLQTTLERHCLTENPNDSDKYYFIGGIADGSVTNALLEYTFSTDTW